MLYKQLNIFNIIIYIIYVDIYNETKAPQSGRPIPVCDQLSSDWFQARRLSPGAHSAIWRGGTTLNPPPPETPRVKCCSSLHQTDQNIAVHLGLYISITNPRGGLLCRPHSKILLISQQHM